MTLLIIGLVLFLGIHSLPIFVRGSRERMVQSLGRNGWRTLHSVVSLVGFGLIVVGYGQARMAPIVLYSPPYGMHHVTFLLMLPVFPLIFAAALPGRIKAAVKHPMLAALVIWAIAHLLSNGMVADVVLFGSFLLWAVVDGISLRHRQSSLNIAVKPGPWNDVIAVVAGLALYAAALLWLHRLLIGVPLI